MDTWRIAEMDKQRNVAPSSKILMIPIVILSIIGISILALIVVFFLSLQDTVYPLPIGPIIEMQTEDTSIPFRITSALLAQNFFYKAGR